MEKEKVKKKHSHVLLIVLITLGALILIAFGVLNVLWFRFHQMVVKYEDTTGIETIAGEDLYQKRDGDYLFYIGSASYLDFDFVAEAQDNKNSVALLCWPHLFSEDEYGLMFTAGGESGQGGVTEDIQIHIDREGNPIFAEGEEQEYVDKITALIDSKKDVIDALFDAYDGLYGLYDRGWKDI